MVRIVVMILKEKTRYYKEDKEGTKIMFEAWEEERLEGEFEGKFASLKSLMKNTSMALEEAMNTLELNEEEKKMCRERI